MGFNTIDHCCCLTGHNVGLTLLITAVVLQATMCVLTLLITAVVLQATMWVSTLLITAVVVVSGEILGFGI